MGAGLAVEHEVVIVAESGALGVLGLGRTLVRDAITNDVCGAEVQIRAGHRINLAGAYTRTKAIWDRPEES